MPGVPKRPAAPQPQLPVLPQPVSVADAYLAAILAELRALHAELAAWQAGARAGAPAKASKP